MYKTIIIPVRASPRDTEYLNTLNERSAAVWNKCVALDKESQDKNGSFLSMKELQKAIKGFGSLHSRNICHVFMKYLSARVAMCKSIKAKHKNSSTVKLPYREKKFFPTGWDGQSSKVDYEHGTISLSRKTVTSAGGRRVRQTPIVCHAKTIPRDIREIELVYRNGLKLAIKYIEPDIQHVIQSNNSAAIDLGEIHAIASIESSGNSVIITGRKLRSIKRLRNKEQSKLRSLMSKCTKGSRRYRKYNHALYRLKYKAEKQIVDAVHKITKLYLDFCLENNISTVYYGDLDSCTRNTKGRANKYIGQKLNEWNYGLITTQLTNKLERYGIKTIKIKEYYTSKKCPYCGNTNNPMGRNYSCSCGYRQHRDLVGAMNILNENAKTNISRYRTIKYLRIA